jgi:hypothetical protein
VWWLIAIGVVYLVSRGGGLVAPESSDGSDGSDVGAVPYDDLIFAGGDDVGSDSVVSAIADQIEKREGIFSDSSKPLEPKTGLRGSRAFRNNNPGNLRSSGDLGFATRYDQTKDSADKYGVFSSYAVGRAALEADIRAKMLGHTRSGLGPDSTLLDLFKVYAPSSDANDPVSYATEVAEGIGATISTTLGDLWNGAFGDS